MNWNCYEGRGGRVPADSFPITNVMGEDFWIAVLSVAFAEERNERRDVRGRGIVRGEFAVGAARKLRDLIMRVARAR